MSEEDNLQTLYVRPYHWEAVDGGSVNDKMEIRAWCLDKESIPYLLKVEFPVFCQVELPKVVDGSFFRWDSTTAGLVHEAIERILDTYSPYPFNNAKFGKRKKLYYYQGEQTFPMLLVSFTTREAMKRLEWKLKYPLNVSGLGEVKCNIWEAEIDVIMKMLTKCEITHTSWIECDGEHVPDGKRISKLHNEYVVDWRSLEKLDDEFVKGWEGYPGILAFDVESYSDNHKKFPDRWNAKHVAYMISCTYQRYGDPTRYRYGIIMGECEEIPEDVFPNTILFTVNNEEEVNRMMMAIMEYHDPEFIVGYNIFGFDYPYLDARISRLGQNWANASRLKNGKCRVKTTSWSSGAYGHVTINNFDCPGRVSEDIYNVIKRNHKLSMYNLSSVSMHFLGKDKHDVSAPEMFQYYENMLETIRTGQGNGIKDITKVMLYCIQDSELVLDLMDKISWWFTVVEMSAVVSVPISHLHTRGQQIRCDNQLYRIGSNSGYILDFKERADIPFVGGFVGEPIPGFHRNVHLLDFNSLYPSIIIAFNMCWSTFIPERYWKYLEPETYHIIVVTFTDDMNVIGDSVDTELNETGEEVHNIKSKSKSKFTGSVEFRYIKKEIREGILPRLCRELCSERKRVRSTIKGDPDHISRSIKNAKQLALKVSANSFFGFVGVVNGAKRPLAELAVSITAKGREMINKCNEYALETYGAIAVYGDTDSSMFIMPEQLTIENPGHYWGDRLARELSELFPEDIVMEREITMNMIPIKKKKYAGCYLKDNGEMMRDDKGNPKLMTKGILVARRDNCKKARDSYWDLLYMIFEGKPFIEAVRYLANLANDHFNCNIDYSELIMVRSLGKSYKNNNYFMKVFADELSRLGKPVQPGERIEYVIVDRPNASTLGYKMLTPELYEESQLTHNPEKIDYVYYLEKLLQNHLSQLISAGYAEDIKRLEHITYRHTNRHGWTGLDNIVKMMIRMNLGGLNPSDLIGIIEKEEFAIERLKVMKGRKKKRFKIVTK